MKWEVFCTNCRREIIAMQDFMNRLVCMNCGSVVGKRQDDKDNKKNK